MLGQVQGASWVLIHLYMSGPLCMTFVMGGNSRPGSRTAPPCTFFKIWQHFPERSALYLRQTLWKTLSFQPQENTSEATSFFKDLDLSPLPSHFQFVAAASFVLGCLAASLCFSRNPLLVLSSAPTRNRTCPRESRWPPSFHLRMVVFPYVESQFL